jgi:excisionase family DNA binding protein
MNKQEAAEYLGVSVRALERYVQQGRISVKYEKGKTRSTASFDETELERFRDELNQVSVKPAIDSRQVLTDEPRQISTQTLVTSESLVIQHDNIGDIGEITTIDKLASIIESLINEKQPSIAVGEKLLLTVAECQQLTGLSKEHFRDAISSGELPAKVIGKSWRVKRSDLEQYVSQLF